MDVYDNGKLNAVRNSDGIWINTEVFREEGRHFEKHGYYTPDNWGTVAWKEYWDEQHRRCKEGYEVGGVKITGHHYAYLNFYPIMRKEEGKKRKISGFPYFWDGDYNYYHALEIAANDVTRDYVDNLGLEVKIPDEYLTGGYHVCVGKSRRKGYSFKNAALGTNTFVTEPNSLVILAAFLDEYLTKGIMKMVNKYLGFLDEHTAFKRSRDYLNKVNNKRASYKKILNGQEIEKGLMSEIMTITFKDNPDAARGKDGTYVIMEEAGKWPNLIPSYMAIKPALEAGIYTTGQIIIFGTGGDMEKGTKDFAEMFYNPKKYGLMAFENIWDDDNSNPTCGFFHPVFWNFDGCTDEQGNSDKEKAIAYQEKLRKEILDNSNDSSTLNLHTQEYPFMPKEAFLQTSYNDFPVIELREQRARVLKDWKRIANPVQLYYDNNGKVKTKMVLDGSASPIIGMEIKENNMTGCPVIYEMPIESPPTGLYKIGYDPYRQDNSSSSTPSLGAAFVYKSANNMSYNSNMIVAEYVGRPKTAAEFNRQVMMLAELYNAKIMYENEVPEVKNYFRRHKKLHLLEVQPDAVISKSIKKSTVNRVYGIHMNKQLKDAGEKYIKEWLLEERNFGDDGKAILNLHKIFSVGLLEELINYNDKGNFDRVMALMMLMFFVQNDSLNKVYSKKQKLDTRFSSFYN